MPKVSVLITVYNDEKNIFSAAKSILDQTYQDFELVIVDDGSTDNTPVVLKELAARDPRVLILTQSNSGTTVASNNGLKKCTGEFVARLDSDDISYPNRLELGVNFLMKNSQVGVVGGNCDIMDESGNVIGSRIIKTNNPMKTLLHRCIFQQSDIMFRKDIVMKLGGYRSKFRNSQDYDLWLRISDKAEVAKLDSILGAWRLNAGGYTLSRAEEQWKEVGIIKAMAKLRKAGLDDGYDEFVPSENVIKHREVISEDQYTVIVAQTMLKALRQKETRALIKGKNLGFKTNITILVMSYLPKFLLKSLFDLREYYINNFR